MFTLFRRPGGRRLLVAAGLVLLMLTSLLGFSRASAAPPYATKATITEMKFVSDSAPTWEWTQLTGKWQLPDHPTTPAGLEVILPDGLAGVATTFPMMSEAAPGRPSIQMGTCTVTSGKLYCDIDDSYINENPLGLKGSFELWVQVTKEVTEDTKVVFDFGDVSGSITVTPPTSGRDCCTSW